MASQFNSQSDIINQQGTSGIAVNKGIVEKVIVNPPKQTQQKQPPHNFPGNLVSNFIGREKELALLDNVINNANQVAISAVAGMGGVGKSELAKQYINQYQESYPGGICWLNAAEDNFISKIIELSNLGNDEALKQRKDLTDKIKYCYNNWQWQGNILLVFDDVQNYQHIKTFLPNQSRFKVLITTRKRLGKPVVRLDLDVLSPSAALDLLASFIEIPEAEREKAQELCEWLGRLPLGLELVVRYLAKRNISLAEMLERLEKKSLEHKSLKEVPEESNAERGVKAAFELSWETLQENPNTQETAYFLSLFALAPIPQELLVNSNLREDWEDMEDALVDLKNLNLVKFLLEKSYSLHSLIREFIHTKESQFDALQLKQVMCKTMVEKAREIPESAKFEIFNTLKPIIPHLQEVAKHLPDYLVDEDVMKPFIGLGRFYEGQGLYNLAEPWLVQGKKIAIKRLGDQHPNVATIINNLAGLYESQGRYEEADNLYQQALEIHKIVLPENHPRLAYNLNNLASFYYSQGRYEEAESLFKKVMEIDKISLSENDPSFATHLNNLGELYKSQGRYEEA